MPCRAHTDDAQIAAAQALQSRPPQSPLEAFAGRWRQPQHSGNARELGLYSVSGARASVTVV